MKAIINYLQFVFYKIVDLLSVRPFNDFPVSILQLILVGIILKYVFRFVFGGFKETEVQMNYFNNKAVSRSINNIKREKQLAYDQKETNLVSSSLKQRHLSKKERKELDNMLEDIRWGKVGYMVLLLFCYYVVLVLLVYLSSI